MLNKLKFLLKTIKGQHYFFVAIHKLLVVLQQIKDIFCSTQSFTLFLATHTDTSAQRIKLLKHTHTH